GGVIDILEHERRGLVDRGRACAGGRIGLRAGVNGKRGKSRSAFGHRGPVLVGVKFQSLRVYRSRKGRQGGGGGCGNSRVAGTLTMKSPTRVAHPEGAAGLIAA